MAKKKNSKIEKIEKNLMGLLDKKNSLLKSLINCEEQFNSLISDVKTADDWVYGLPIDSIKDLNNPNRKSRLGVLRTRSELRKSSLKTLSEIDSLDNQIKLVKVDLISEKINHLLK
jgi:hypothetical protein